MNRYAVDSRKVEPKDTFFALKGAKTDGHLYLKEVAARGGKRAVVEKGYQGEDFGLELIYVESPLKELHRLAKDRLERGHPLKIGVTGSFAKTTTKEALSQALGGFKTPMNANSQLGIPIAILNGYRDEKVAVIEMGIEYPGEMESLVDLVMPQIVVITRIAPAHLETLGGMAGIIEEKKKIARHAKHLFLHYSIQDLIDVPGVIKHVYGKKDEALFEDLQDLCEKMQQLLGLKKTVIEIPQMPLRFETKTYDKGEVVFDCYNANPTTMEQFFLETKKEEPGKRRVAVIGEMVCLGEVSDEWHLKTIEAIEQTFDVAFFIGKGTKVMHKRLLEQNKEAYFAENLEELQRLLKKQLKEKDLVLVKGSNSNRLWEIEPCLQQIFSI